MDTMGLDLHKRESQLCVLRQSTGASPSVQLLSWLLMTWQ
jgi:hypothetical protein